MNKEKNRIQQAVKSKRQFSRVSGYSLRTINKMIDKGQLKTKMVGDNERILYEVWKRDIGVID